MKSIWPLIVLFCTFISLLLPKTSFADRIDELSSMAKQGQVEAQFTLAEVYYFGKGTGKNLKQALFWYEKAAQQGPFALCRLLAMHHLRAKPQPGASPPLCSAWRYGAQVRR